MDDPPPSSGVPSLEPWVIHLLDSGVLNAGQLGKAGGLSKSWREASRAACTQTLSKTNLAMQHLLRKLPEAARARALADAELSLELLPAHMGRPGYSAKHDSAIVSAARAHGVRLATTVGGVIMRLAKASGRPGVALDESGIGFFEVKPFGQGEHPWGTLSVELAKFSGPPEAEDVEHPMGVIVSFVKAGRAVVSWHFYAGSRAWLLINVASPEFRLVDDFLADEDLCRLKPKLAQFDDASRVAAARAAKAAAAIRALEQATAFFLRLQGEYLEPTSDGTGSSSALPPPHKFLPRCQHKPCSSLCLKRLTCSKCKLAGYCSRECQRADWPSHQGPCTPPADRVARNTARSARVAELS